VTEQLDKSSRALKQSTLVIAAGVAGAVLATSLDLADKVFRITDRFHYTSSEAMILARESEKSKFSDNLIRGMHRRLMLADIFARRVQDEAEKEKIDEAWKSYVAALIDWNASDEFEADILPMFADLDTCMRALYLSRLAKESLSRPPIPSATTCGSPGDIGTQVQAVLDRTRQFRDVLYVFVRCFRQGHAASAAGSCTIRDLGILTPDGTARPQP
jgi:hypothetical protein